MIHNPFVPGTCWQLPTGRFFIDRRCRFVHADGPLAGEIAAVVPDTTGYVQLYLTPTPTPALSRGAGHA